MDLCSKKIVGWAFGNSLTGDLVIRALQQALTQRGIPDDLTIHSDRGVQYSCHAYRNIIAKNNIVQSMSCKRNCYDNAVMESFLKTLKTELVHWERYATRDEAKKSIFEYVEIYYNRKRMHSSIGYMSPEEFKRTVN